MPIGPCVRSVCVVVLLAAPAAAQTTTEDGIRALLRADHKTAARILGPLADSASRPDPVAQFFLGLVHSDIHGGRFDQIRACGLFLRSASHAHPFAEQSAALAADIQLQLQGAASLCVAGERWQGGPAPSFEPGPGPRIVVADTSVTVTDGVAALAGGDYQKAVEILKPIAEDWRSHDTAAQFFMAGLYDTGRGVPADPVRACALYLRAAGESDRPLSREASALFGSSINRGREFDADCQYLANVGFDHGFEPIAFNLGPGHDVEWTLRTAAVTYRGQTRREQALFVQPGSRFLPLRYTELATGPNRALTRHFIEAFVWWPTGPAGPWRLHWNIFEVVRDEIVRIDGPDDLVTVEGERPPSREAFDLHDYAVLRVDDDGQAEWAVLKGAHAATRPIETDAERRGVREERQRRDAALKAVDWNRRQDVNRPPTLAVGDADGCGRFQVYGWTADRAEAVVVSADASELGLAGSPAVFDLSRQLASISVGVHVYDAPQRRFDFCSDVRMPPSPESAGPEIWRAVAGTMSIELSAGVRADHPHLRRATVALSNIVLRNSVGRTLTVPQPVRLTAVVGSMY